MKKRFNVALNSQIYDLFKGHLASKGMSITGWVKVKIKEELNMSDEEFENKDK